MRHASHEPSEHKETKEITGVQILWLCWEEGVEGWGTVPVLTLGSEPGEEASWETEATIWS